MTQEQADVFISIHAPREGSDVTLEPGQPAAVEFLSTLPARGATQSVRGRERKPAISIHAPREGSDLCGGVVHNVDNSISIHAPREGSDL